MSLSLSLLLRKSKIKITSKNDNVGWYDILLNKENHKKKILNIIKIKQLKFNTNILNKRKKTALKYCALKHLKF